MLGLAPDGFVAPRGSSTVRAISVSWVSTRWWVQASEHLALSLAAGPPTHMNKHHPELRQYLLDQANLLM
jgi:hypothetical protein